VGESVRRKSAAELPRFSSREESEKLTRSPERVTHMKLGLERGRFTANLTHELLRLTASILKHSMLWGATILHQSERFLRQLIQLYAIITTSLGKT